MEGMQIFNYQNNEIRTVEKDGEVWFVLKDVCGVLGITHVKDTADRLEMDEVGQTEVIDAIGRNQTTTIINESGLYNVILRSDKPEAKPFRKWVTSEVLPSIRKHGMYAIDELIESPDLAIKALTALKEERAKRKALQQENAEQKQQLAEFSPKASYYDVVLQTKDAMSVSQIAKDYGKSAQWLNEYLNLHGVQFRQGGVWLLYQKYAELGYTKSKTQVYCDTDGKQHSKLHTYWTQKGRLFIYDLLKKNGILPLMERENRISAS